MYLKANCPRNAKMALIEILVNRAWCVCARVVFKLCIKQSKYCFDQ